MVNDPIADMLTRIRNAVMVGHESVLMPHSSVKGAIAKILMDQSFIEGYEVVKNKPADMMRIQLKYNAKQPAVLGLERVSRPGLRVYAGKTEIPRVYGGLGFAVVSTSKGIMTGQEAWRRKLGGEILCYVW